MAPSIFIAIAGGAASGKKTVQAALQSTLLSLHTGPAEALTIELLHQRDFRRLPTSASGDADGLGCDSPHTLPQRTQAAELTGTRLSQRVCAETYDLDGLAAHVRRSHSTVVIAEGSYLLTHAALLALAAVKVFVDSDADVRLARRVLAQSPARLQATLEHHVAFGKRNYEAVVAPTKQVADIILPDARPDGNGVLLIASGVMDDIVKAVGARTGAPPRGKTHESKGVLCEADLTMGMPTYYETV